MSTIQAYNEATDRLPRTLDHFTEAHLDEWCARTIAYDNVAAFYKMREAMETCDASEYEYYMREGWPALADSLGIR